MASVTLAGDWMISVGNRREVIGLFNFDSSYPTGGESLTAASIGLGVLDFISFDQGQGGYVFDYDYANSKILVYQQTDPAAVGGANIPLVEVTNTTSLATLVAKFRAIGR